MSIKIRNWVAVAAHFKKSAVIDNKKEIIPRKQKHKKKIETDE